jgi:hypothetical protein
MAAGTGADMLAVVFMLKRLRRSVDRNFISVSNSDRVTERRHEVVDS